MKNEYQRNDMLISTSGKDIYASPTITHHENLKSVTQGVISNLQGGWDKITGNDGGATTPPVGGIRG